MPSDQPPMLFDRQASNVDLDPLALKAWGASTSVFVSSLITSMRDERDAVRAAITSVGARPVMFEHDLGAQDIPADRAYLEGVRESGIYVGIFGESYGVRLASGFSATHEELLEAERLGLRLCIFTVADREVDGHQRDLIAGVRNMNTTAPYSDSIDLGERVQRRLMDLAAEEIVPWARIGRVLLRGQSTVTGDVLGVAANVWDRAIVAELQTMHDRRMTVPYATIFGAGEATMTSLTVTSKNAMVAEVSISLQLRQSSGHSMRMSTNGLGPDDIARMALSDGILGTSLLGGDLKFLAHPVNPLAPVRDLQIPERALRPIAQLLLAEHLIRSGDASSVGALILGPTRHGRRAIRVTWRPARYYTDGPDPEPITLDGFTTLI